MENNEPKVKSRKKKFSPIKYTLSGNQIGVVLNTSMGQYCLSDRAIEMLRSQKCPLPHTCQRFSYEDDRTYTPLVNVVKELGDEASQPPCRLKVVNIPIELEDYYYVESADGCEYINIDYDRLIREKIVLLTETNVNEWKAYINTLLEWNNSK